VGGAGKLAPRAGVWPWRSPETGTTRGQLRGRARSWETGTSCGCLALAVARNGHHPGATPGTCEELGNWHLVRVFGPGDRLPKPSELGN
jgi:hypothetical protein